MFKKPWKSIKTSWNFWKFRCKIFTFNFNFSSFQWLFLNLNSLSADSIFSLESILCGWFQKLRKISQQEDDNDRSRAWYDGARASNSIRMNRTILLLPPRVHLAPSRLSRRGKSEEVVIRIELKMLILSQMTKPQTVLSILSYLSISIAIYWKLNNSENWMNSE